MNASYVLQYGIKMKKKRIPIIPGLCSRILRYVYGCDIPLTVEIEGGVLNLAHNGLGIVIHQDVTFGSGCKIYQNVTIGEGKAITGGINKNKKSDVPRIMNNVRIYAGAVLLGGISVGNNSVIGANAVVLSDVPDNCMAVGVPAKIISI